MLAMVPLLALIIVLALLPFPPEAGAADASVHTVAVTSPSSRDFTLATLNLRRPARDIRVSVVGSPGQLFVAVVAVGAEPLMPVSLPPPLSVASRHQHRAARQVLILVVDRQTPTSGLPQPAIVILRIRTGKPQHAPNISQHVDVLARGASGQDCSRLTSRNRYLYGSDLEGELLVSRRPRTRAFWAGDPTETVAHALDQACGRPPDSQFSRWVRDEPPIPHP
jgi:hypothetical protein